MANHQVKILETEHLTHNVKRFVLQKPPGYEFKPGQATDLSLFKKGWESELRPFTFTSLPEEEVLELTIKIYDDHEGVTHHLGMARPGDALQISDPWGAIEYRGEGVFIAGGAGITPFISIFRSLAKDHQLGGNRLFFSNKTQKDIIHREEFEKMLHQNFVNIITQETTAEFINARIDKQFLKEHIDNYSQHFYVCGPDLFTITLVNALEELGASPEVLIFEK